MKNKIFIVVLVFMLTGFTVVARADTSNSISKQVLLTFDDGPNPRYTNEVLNILKDNNIKAVFFVVGKEVEKHPDLLKRVADHGHVIGNHTYSHKIINGIGRNQLKREVQLTDAAIYRVTGESTKYFRPPTGDYSSREAKMLKEFNKTVLMWDYGIEKQAIEKAPKMVKHLMKRIGGKQEIILLLHDGDPNEIHNRDLTVEALIILIERLRVSGYEFVDPACDEGQMFMDKFAEQHPKVGI